MFRHTVYTWHLHRSQGEPRQARFRTMNAVGNTQIQRSTESVLKMTSTSLDLLPVALLEEWGATQADLARMPLVSIQRASGDPNSVVRWLLVVPSNWNPPLGAYRLPGPQLNCSMAGVCRCGVCGDGVMSRGVQLASLREVRLCRDLWGQPYTVYSIPYTV